MLSFQPGSKAILIGTSISASDPENLPDIPQVLTNLDDFREILSDVSVVGLEPEDIEIVANIDSREGFLKKLKDIAQSAKDTLLVYYCGHGLYGDAKEPLYFCTSGTTSHDKEIDGVPISAVKSAIAASSAKKRIFLLDCCYAGQAIEGAMDAVDGIEAQLDVEGTYAIGAVPRDKKAIAEPKARNTVFFEHFREAISSGVDNGKNTVSIAELHQETEKSISRTAKYSLPVKRVWEDGDKFEFCINQFNSTKLTKTDIEKIIESRLQGIVVTKAKGFKRFIVPSLVGAGVIGAVTAIGGLVWLNSLSSKHTNLSTNVSDISSNVGELDGSVKSLFEADSTQSSILGTIKNSVNGFTQTLETLVGSDEEKKDRINQLADAVVEPDAQTDFSLFRVNTFLDRQDDDLSNLRLVLPPEQFRRTKLLRFDDADGNELAYIQKRTHVIMYRAGYKLHLYLQPERRNPYIRRDNLYDVQENEVTYGISVAGGRPQSFDPTNSNQLRKHFDFTQDACAHLADEQSEWGYIPIQLCFGGSDDNSPCGNEVGVDPKTQFEFRLTAVLEKSLEAEEVCKSEE